MTLPLQKLLEVFKNLHILKFYVIAKIQQDGSNVYPRMVIFGVDPTQDQGEYFLKILAQSV